MNTLVTSIVVFLCDASNFKPPCCCISFQLTSSWPSADLQQTSSWPTAGLQPTSGRPPADLQLTRLRPDGWKARPLKGLFKGRVNWILAALRRNNPTLSKKITPCLIRFLVIVHADVRTHTDTHLHRDTITDMVTIASHNLNPRHPSTSFKNLKGPWSHLEAFRHETVEIRKTREFLVGWLIRRMRRWTDFHKIPKFLDPDDFSNGGGHSTCSTCLLRLLRRRKMSNISLRLLPHPQEE